MAKTRGGATLVAAGIFLSRIAGLVRESIFARYFGDSVAADAFRAALRIPNFLQNLFGEGVLSASFIPVYAGLVARGKREEAGRVAGAVFAILALLTSTLVLMGVLVLSAWCLGILNSHRRFFLSYSVPVLWNIAMIAALVWFGPRAGQDRLAGIVAWAS